jgi:hypothetical protein
MYNNYDYPWGADGPNAPWNQVEIPEREFDATISSSLSKSTTIESKDYIIEEDPEYSYIDTSDIAWTKEYQKQHYTPLGLINEFKTFLEEQKEKETDKSKIHKIEYLIKECSDWNEDELEVVEG